MEIEFHGATGTVTGSKYLVSHGGTRLLVDCGLFQGYKQLRLRNWSAPGFDPASLDAVVLTHAHLDHSGYLPLLVRQGFRGPVYCASGTMDLCRVMLPDSGRIQEEDAEQANRHHHTKHKPARPLYTEADAFRALEQFEPVPYDVPMKLGALNLGLRNAGHLLGSSMVRLDDGRQSLMFSGDLGRPNDPMLLPPAAPEATDTLVVESTYGNRLHEAADPLVAFGEVMARVAARGGVAVIPAFTVGRAQLLMYFLHQLKLANKIPAGLPVYLNSPMAVDATRIYRRHRAEQKLPEGEFAAMCESVRFVNTVEDSRALNLRRGPMVIIAGSGMATGGRVLHHLKAFGPDPNNAIVLSGFQAGGTRGAALLAGADAIKIHGEYVPIRAEVVAPSNVSAHADYGEILSWLRRFPKPPRLTFITHGEPEAADAMRKHIEEELGWTCVVPDYRDRMKLDAAA